MLWNYFNIKTAIEKNIWLIWNQAAANRKQLHGATYVENRYASTPLLSKFHLVKMENKIIEYEKKIEILERKVSDLEKHNAGLREVLINNVQFSTKLSNITYEMDCLLVKKSQEIRDLQELLENCPH